MFVVWVLFGEYAIIFTIFCAKWVNLECKFYIYRYEVPYWFHFTTRSIPNKKCFFKIFTLFLWWMVGGSVVDFSILGISWLEVLNKYLSLGMSLWGERGAQLILVLILSLIPIKNWMLVQINYHCSYWSVSYSWEVIPL